MRPKPRKITSEEWSQNKNAIINLRRSGLQLEGEYGIMATMEVNYGFKASSAQYELQLGKWGERKNLTKEEWPDVLRYLDHCDRDGVKYKVYLSGKQVPSSTLKKKKRLYCRGSGYKTHGRVHLSKDDLPEGIEVRTSGLGDNTPDAMNIDDVHEISPTAVGSKPIPSDEPMSGGDSISEAFSLERDLDSFVQPLLAAQSPNDNISDTEKSVTCELESAFGISRSLTPVLSHSLCSYPLFPAIAGTTLSNIFLNSSTELSLKFPPSINDPVIEVDSNPANIIRIVAETPARLQYSPNLIEGWDLPSPFFDFYQQSLPQELQLFDGHALSPTAITNTQAAFGTAADLEKLRITTRRCPLGTLARSNPEAILSNLSTLLLPDTMSQISILDERTTAQCKVFGSSNLRLLITSIENNFAGLEDMKIGNILKLLQSDSTITFQLLEYFRIAPINVSRVIAEKLICAAIENSDSTTVTVLLNTRLVTADAVVCTFENQKYTGLELAAMLRSIEVTKSLLEAGADVNKAYNWSRRGCRGALDQAIGRVIGYESVDMRLISMLLGRGAEVRFDILAQAVGTGDIALVKALISKFPSLEHKKAIEDEFFLPRIVRYFDNEDATMVVTQIVNVCPQTNTCTCLQSGSTGFQESIILAASRGNFQLVLSLLDYVIDKEWLLTAAVRSCRKDMIDFLLEKGVNIDAPAREIDDGVSKDSITLTTPLAEAIRAGDGSLVQYFETRGALSQIDEPDRFYAATYAASEAGNLSYLQKLLQLNPEVPSDILNPPLCVSIEKGYSDIAYTLLYAGADVGGNGSHPRSCSRVNTPLSKMDHPIVGALIQRNEDLVRIILYCDMNLNDLRPETQYLRLWKAAVEFGDIHLLQEILSCSPARCYRYLPSAVGYAARADNKHMIEHLIKLADARNLMDSDYQGGMLNAVVSNEDTSILQYILRLGVDPSNDRAIATAVSENKNAAAVLISAFRGRYPDGKKGFGSEALGIALVDGDIEIVEMLLDVQADVNKIITPARRVLDYKNPFGVAMDCCDTLGLNIIRKLLCAGADPNGIVFQPAGYYSEIPGSHTALLHAIRTKSKALVQLLINSGADIHRPAQLGVKRTPLQYACEVGSAEIIDLLIENGAKVNEEPALRGGATSLQLCAMKGYVGIAKKLLDLGADIHAPPSKIFGRSPLEGAAENGRIDMLRLLWDAAGRDKFDSKIFDSAMRLAEKSGHMVCRDLLQRLYLSSYGSIMSESFSD